MTKEKQRLKIAEACGYTRQEPDSAWFDSLDNEQIHIDDLPDYLNDLNAMSEAKRQLLTTFGLCNTFQNYLLEERPHPAPYETDKWTWGQSAEIETVALLRTLNLWKP